MSESSEFAEDLHRKILETEAGRDLPRCFACGTCSSGCPVHEQRPEFDPRKIIRSVLMGLESELFDSGVIWLCSTCYTCLERCPQEVGCAQIITELRNAAAADGRAPEAFRMQMEALRQFGRVYEIEDFDNRRRQKMGLAVLDSHANIEPLLTDEREGE
ncbi:4Fe-4S dicluster domain-containing protein [Candidatus Sumerlaeota bacterium]|nr:4Fe-4S dicluster domain-containing protein [Candidatus Sumerlaeota bacterium]